MAGKRIPQNNTPVVSPTDFQERKVKEDAKEAQRAYLAGLQNRVRALEQAERDYTARIQTLELERDALGSELLILQKENIEMKQKAKTVGAQEPLDDPIKDEDLELKRKSAKARQLPKKGKVDEKEAENKEEDL